jgi:hypothetical protein
MDGRQRLRRDGEVQHLKDQRDILRRDDIHVPEPPTDGGGARLGIVPLGDRTDASQDIAQRVVGDRPAVR